MRFSDCFGIPGTQAHYDFVDVPLDTDMKVFVDPYALATNGTTWSHEAHDITFEFFQKVLDHLRAGNRSTALALVCRLHEDNRTRTGYSKQEPEGNGLGRNNAELFLAALESSSAFQSGRIEDIEDTSLFVGGIGVDIVSDMIINILREMLVKYTHSQCDLYNIPIDFDDTIVAWRKDTGWTEIGIKLPSHGGRGVILLPRVLVRKDLSLQPGGYIREVMDAHDRGDVNAVRALEKTLQNKPLIKKNGKIRRNDTKNELKGKGTEKDITNRLNEEYPGLIKMYKDHARRDRTPLSPEELDDINPERKRRNDITAENKIAAANANEIWDAVRGITGELLSLLHPLIQQPSRFSTGINGVNGVVLYNAGLKGLLEDARNRDGRRGRDKILMLSSNTVIDGNAVARLDADRLMAQTNSGLIFFIAPNIDAQLKRMRASLRKLGVVVLESREISRILETYVSPEKALDSIELLLAA